MWEHRTVEFLKNGIQDQTKLLEEIARFEEFKPYLRIFLMQKLLWGKDKSEYFWLKNIVSLDASERLYSGFKPFKSKDFEGSGNLLFSATMNKNSDKENQFKYFLRKFFIFR